MDLRHIPDPYNYGKYLYIDMDDRDKLTEAEASALRTELTRAATRKKALNEHIRKITQRLVLSGEEKNETA